MRLERLDAHVFGALRGKTLELDPRVAIVFGPNEAGKSTFLSALETVIFGFEPSTRVAHPLAQWLEGTPFQADLHIEADVALEEGAAIRVERVLLRRGTLRVVPAGESFTGKRESNRPLHEVHGVSRELFQAVYALHSSDLIELRADLRDAVDQLLLGERSIAGMRPTYRVRAELIDEASAMWRDDNRGKPKSGELKKAVREARKAVQSAREEESGLREALEEKRTLEALLEQHRATKRTLEREESEAAFLKDVFELETRRSAVLPVDLSALAGTPFTDPDALAKEARALERKLAEPLARLARKPLVSSAALEAVLARASDIATLVSSRGRHEAERESFQETRERARSLEQGVAAGFARLTGRAPDENDLEQLRTFPLAGLRAAHETWTRAWEAGSSGPKETRPDRGARWRRSRRAPAMHWPRRTRSPGFTIAAEGAPMCCERGRTISSTKGIRSIASPFVACLLSSGWDATAKGSGRGSACGRPRHSCPVAPCRFSCFSWFSRLGRSGRYGRSSGSRRLDGLSRRFGGGAKARQAEESLYDSLSRLFLRGLPGSRRGARRARPRGRRAAPSPRCRAPA